MKDFNEIFLFKFEEINCLIFFYVYIDYFGCIFKLVKEGFFGCIYSMYVMCSLCFIMLLDSVMIQIRDVEYFNKRMKKKGKKFEVREFLYKVEYVYQIMKQFVSYVYDCWF